MHTLLPDFSVTNPTTSSVKNIYSVELNDVFLFHYGFFPKDEKDTKHHLKQWKEQLPKRHLTFANRNIKTQRQSR